MGAKTTLTEQVYQELYHDIIKQRLHCGQKLTLKELKERFGISQTPIREALTRLTEEGLVNTYTNLGVAVIDFTDADIRELYQCISEFDALAILFCKNSFTHAPLIYDLEQIVDARNQCLAAGDIEGWSHYSDAAHLIFYRHAQNRYLDDSAKRLRAKVNLLSNMYYYSDPVYSENINYGHNEILDCIKTGDFDEAANIMRVHLQYNMVYALNAYRESKNKRDADK